MMMPGRIIMPRADAAARVLDHVEQAFEQGEARDDHREGPGPGLQGPQAERGQQPGDATGDRQPAPEADALERRDVTQRAEPVEAEQSQAEEQPGEAGHGPEEAEDRDKDGRVLHVGRSPSMRCGGRPSRAATVGATRGSAPSSFAFAAANSSSVRTPAACRSPSCFSCPCRWPVRAPRRRSGSDRSGRWRAAAPCWYACSYSACACAGLAGVLRLLVVADGAGGAGDDGGGGGGTHERAAAATHHHR